jgi:hypothetical protein
MPSCFIESVNPFTMVIDLGGLCTFSELIILDIFFSFIG